MAESTTKKNTDGPRKRVVILHNILWAHYKGVVFSSLAKVAADEGYDVHVLHISESDKQRDALGSVDSNLHTYPHTVLFPGSLNEVGLVKKSLGVARALIGMRFEFIVISGYSDVSYWVALFVGRLKGAKVIVTIDSTAGDRHRYRLVEAVKRWFVGACDGAFVYGTRSIEYCMKLGIQRRQIFVRCQATDGREISHRFEAEAAKRPQLIAQFSAAPRNLIFVGRLSPEKNILRALTAFQRAQSTLGEEGDSWGFILVGDGPDRQVLEEWCLSSGVRNVRFLGSCGWRDVARFYAMADIFVLPSSSEPWGLAVNEAMECSLPVLVSHACGAAPDLVLEGASGYCFDPLDVDQLSSLMTKLMTDGTSRADLGRRSKEIIQANTPERAARQMLDGLKAIGGSRPHGNGRRPSPAEL